jgi:hypothetical protein
MCDSKELLVGFLYDEIDPGEANVRASRELCGLPRGTGGAGRDARRLRCGRRRMPISGFA